MNFKRAIPVLRAGKRRGKGSSVVDVANSPSFEDTAVLQFFETSGRNLCAAEEAAGVGHYVALSVVGTDRLPDSGYFRAKLAQEALIKASPVPYTILRATQFFEFVGTITQSGVQGDAIHLPHTLMQPVAAEDVAAALADIAVAAPVNGTIDLAGPESIAMDDLVRRFLTAKHDDRPVVADANARYFGASVTDQSLRPLGTSLLGLTSFDAWLKQPANT